MYTNYKVPVSEAQQKAILSPEIDRVKKILSLTHPHIQTVSGYIFLISNFNF